MEVRTDSKNGAPVTSPSDTIEAFQAQTQSCVGEWLQQILDEPDRFADIEQQIDQHYRQGGGQLAASFLIKVTENPQMDENVQRASGRRHPAASAPATNPKCPAPLRFGALDHHRRLCSTTHQGHQPQRATRRIIPRTGGLRIRQRLQSGLAIQGGSDRCPEPVDRRGTEGTATRGHRAGQEDGAANR